MPEPDPTLTAAGPPPATPDGGGTVVQTPADLSRAADPVGADAGGELIAGRYRLVGPLGEGGMGEVFLARQSEPVKRDVALKVIRAGMDSKGVLARFEAERQALALMDHPNIAKVFDAGATPTGQPFFVMELVQGEPITAYCDRHRLTPRQRLELFVPVCQAIQHAHQKGVIHRDIKPSNVLVATYDDKPVPKVIDFGVAKATGPQLTSVTLDTGFGVVGTPQYMSPEQATPGQVDIDTRSDVYSLGVLLYELLAGSPPFARRELEKAGLLEVLRMVREDEPPRPSTKLSTADGLPGLSADRGTEPKKLTGLLRSELDWVVMKAISKDRTRRYETATGFAADIERYLAGEAVTAHPPSAAYRLRKVLRRNRGPAVAGGLVAAALVAGLAGTTWGLVRADRARAAEATQRELAEAETVKAVAATAAEAEQRKEAEQANERARKALGSFTDDLMEKQLGSKAELTENEKAIPRNAVAQWEVYAQARGESADGRAARAEGAFRVAKVQMKLGLRAEAEANYRRVVALQEGLAADFPAVPEYRSGLADNHNHLGVLLAGGGTGRGRSERTGPAWPCGRSWRPTSRGCPAIKSALAAATATLATWSVTVANRPTV